MAKKKKPKTTDLTGEDVFIGILVALASGAAVVFLFIGAVAFTSGRQETVDQPPTATVRGSLPSSSPTNTPVSETAGSTTESSNEPVPETSDTLQQTTTPTAAPTQAPVQTQAPAQTQAPTAAPTAKPQTTAPAVTVNPTAPPVQQTQAPAPTPAPSQSGGGTISNGDGTYTHDFSGGRVLATAESNNGGDPVYHTKNCQAAKKIPPENELWYNSSNDAKAAGRRLCGYCGR